MPSMVQKLSHLILGQKGGENRILIIELLRQRPYNANQLAELLKVNYRTVKHHLDILRENGLLTPSTSAGYGEVYFLSPELVKDYEVFRNIVSKLKGHAFSPALFQNFIEQTHDAIMIMDEAERVMFWNRSAERLLGYTEDEILGRTAPIFNDPGFLTMTFKEVTVKNEAMVKEITGKDKSGRPLNLEINVDGIADDEGRIFAYSVLARDIGARKRNEEQLRYLNVLLSAINDVNQLINRTSDINTLMQSAADRLNDTRLFIDVSIGVQRDPGSDNIVLAGHSGAHSTGPWRIAPDGSGEGPECVRAVVKSMKSVIVNGIGTGCDECACDCRDDGHTSVIIPMEYRGTLIGVFSVGLSPGHAVYKKEVTLLEEVVRDLTLARVKMMAENISAENKGRFSSALFAARSGAWDWDLETGTLVWTNGLERIFGRGQVEAGSTHEALLQRVHAEDRDKVAQTIKACLDGKRAYDVEYRTVWPDGSTHWIREAGDIQLDQNNAPTHVLAVVSDLSKRKVLEDELKRTLGKAQVSPIGARDR